MKRKLLFLLLLVLVSIPLYAREVYPVEVVAYSKSITTTGTNFVYLIKEQIRQASNLELADSGPRMVIKIYIISYYPRQPEHTIIFGITWLFQDDRSIYPTFLDSMIGYTRYDAVNTTALSVISTTDKIIEDINKWKKILN